MLSRIEIKEELELFIEWPTDDHGSVSATSTALFAHHVQQKATEKLRAELERVTAELEQRKRDAERLRGALKPFAECADQIDQTEDGEEWAKFRLLVKDYRAAYAALNQQHAAQGCGACGDGCEGQQCRVEAESPPCHSADKLEMVKPECACRVESDDKFGSLNYKCPQHDNSIEGQQAEVKS